MNIKISESFEAILIKDQKLFGTLNSTLADYGDILEDNTLFFFPEYTDHGIKHIEAVLNASSNLMTNDTLKKVLEPKDIFVYILAVLLHDLGMHLSLEGFIHLLSEDYNKLIEPRFDKTNWNSLWKNYLNEAKRFNSKQLLAIFGDEGVTIRNPPLNKRGEISQNDRVLVGEFIRRHHPRIAHEISLKGFPVDNSILSFGNGMDRDLLNLAGLIARSHGMNIRKPLDLIEEKYPKSRRTPYNVHAIFLMVVLRLSDYLQIDSTRTSKIILKTKLLQSPVSIKEHNAHLAIKYIDDKNQDDPERLYVHAEPDSSKLFVKLEYLINDIQNEFDISWAVLGELYGRISPDKPELKYRRIVSNLGDSSFQESLKYIPQKISFQANEELLLLLISPLYGDDPAFGVRELVQNAVDACIEREYLEPQKLGYIGNVNVRFRKENEDCIFEIHDNGKGMNTEEIKNFFLTAGSSYRKSPNWQLDFMDEQGNSLVRRSGKFGIGVLAAFLLGNQITVSTRRYDEEVGTKFSAKVIDEQIELKLDSTISIGTKIQIKLSKNRYEYLVNNEDTFDWFWLAKPKVRYWVEKIEENDFASRKTLPGEDSQLPKEAHEIKTPEYNRIIWTYSSGPKLICNGIRIPGPGPELRPTRNSPITNLPSLNIFDYNGNLPVSLNRSYLTKELTFLDILENDIYKDYIAWLINLKSNQEMGPEMLFSELFVPKSHPGLSQNDYYRHYEDLGQNFNSFF